VFDREYLFVQPRVSARFRRKPAQRSSVFLGIATSLDLDLDLDLPLETLSQLDRVRNLPRVASVQI
jgi:hypothetical protein